MVKRIIVLCISFFVCCLLSAQTDFNSKGMAYVAKGDYVSAKDQFEAAKAVLQSKKVGINSKDFVEIEKKIKYADQCIVLSKKVTAGLGKLEENRIKELFNGCVSENDADQAKESLIETLNDTRSALRIILSKFSSDKVAKSNLERCNAIEATVSSIRNGFPEVLAWKQTIESNSVYAYQSFLEKYPKGNYAVDARSKINEILEASSWEELQADGSFDAYVQYLKDFPNGAHAEEVKAYVSAREEDMCWTSANELETVESYRDYITRFPSGKYLDLAKQRLSECQEKEYWLAQVAKNTVNAYNGYIKQYPTGKYVSMARDNINKLEEKEAWDKALKTNTIEGYKSYLASSRSKAYKKEAENKIAAIEHELEVKADNERWAGIASSTESAVFNEYINGSGYRGHIDEAKGLYYLMKAREMSIDLESSSIVDAYTAAQKYVRLNPFDESRLYQAKDAVAYSLFKRSMTESNAVAYLEAFPQGARYKDVSDALARIKADKMTINVSEQDYQLAMSYAQTPSTRSYVEKAYRENVAAYKKSQRLLRVEPFHALLGIDAIAYTINDATSFDFAPVFSLGGHSNRLNLECGYYLRTGSLVVRPRINLLKKQYHGMPGSSVRDGKDYSYFSFFIAPEFLYIIQPLDETVYVYEGEKPSEIEYYYDSYSETEMPYEYYPKIDYGVRVGLGIGRLDFYGGYRRNFNSFHVGVSWYFGNK